MRANRLGSAAWLVQPLYVAVELVVAAAASATYRLRDDTISALGQLTCAPGHSGSTVLVCSPGHTVLNVAFVVFASLRVLGALLVHPSLAGGRVRGAATALWAASGVCSAAVGLVPVDQRPGLHALVAAPVFVLQPLAVLATAEALRRTPGAVPAWVVTTGLATGALTAAAAAAFGLRLGEQTVGGRPGAPRAVAGIPLAGCGRGRVARPPRRQWAALTAGSTSSTRTPPASLGWMKLTRLSLVPRFGVS